MKLSHRKTQKSIQELYVRARIVSHDILCVADQNAENHLRFLAILEVPGTNYMLKSREEQRRITSQFRSLLAALSYPLQLLVRVLPLNLETYLQQFIPDDKEAENSAHRALRLAHSEHLHSLEAERGGLLGRHFYLIVSADFTSPFQSLPWQRKKKRNQQAIQFQRASEQLNVRCSELQRQLARMRLQAHRLTSTELIDLERSCVMAQRPALQRNVIAGLEQPSQGAWNQQEEREDILPPVILQGEQSLSIFAETRVSAKDKPQTKQKPRPVLPIFSQLADLLAPAAMKLSSHHLAITDARTEYVRSILISNLAYEMPVCWLRPLVEIDDPFIDISIHFRPIPSTQAMIRMQEAQTTFQAKILYSEKKGKILDAYTKVQGEQVISLLPKIAAGEERMLDSSLIVQCRASSLEELDERSQRVLSLLRTMQVEAHPASLLHDDGYRACLPEAQNPIAAWQTLFLDTSSAATLFPFFSSSLYMEKGVMTGITESSEPIILNRWGFNNANAIFIGPSGNGKSYAKKEEIERLWLQAGVQRHFMVMDPEREFKDLCDYIGGQWIRFAPGSGHRINPFDLHIPQQQKNATPLDERGDRLAEKVGSLRELFQIMLARKDGESVLPLEPEALGYLEQAIFEAYRRVGITSKSNVDQEPPLLRDIYNIIDSRDIGEDKFNLLPRLYQYVHGSHKASFDGPTNIQLGAPFVVFDTKEMDTELAPVTLALIAEYVWLHSFNSNIPREFVIDEAGILSKYASWRRFISQLVARARKHYLAVSLMTQSIQDIDETVLTNCATVNLFGYTHALHETFGLSESEAEFLETCGIGEGLLITPTKRIISRFVANPLEHRLNSTNPVERAAWRQEQNPITTKESILRGT